MPTPYVLKLAKEKGMSPQAAEAKWSAAKAAVKSQYPNIKPSDDNYKFYALTVSVFKKMMKVTEDVSAAANTTSTIGGTKDGAVDPSAYVYAPKMASVKHKKKAKNLKEYIEIELNAVQQC